MAGEDRGTPIATTARQRGNTKDFRTVQWAGRALALVVMDDSFFVRTGGGMTRWRNDRSAPCRAEAAKASRIALPDADKL
jgi:hypothetical protein